MEQTAITYCQICEQSCGLKVTVANDQILKIEPDKDNPHSWRDFCIKGARADSVRQHPNRLLTPMERVGSHYEPRTYDQAIEAIGNRLTAIIDESGPAAVASYAGNPNGMDFGGSLFLSMFMDAIESHNRYWVSSVDQNALHYVAEQMYGHAFATLQADIDSCECMLLIGANPAVSGMCWIGHVADGWARLLKRQSEGKLRLIIADPRQSESARKADLHLATEPGQDWALVLGMIKVIFARGLEQKEHCAAATGVQQLRDLAAAASLADLAERCDVGQASIEAIAEQFALANGAAAIARTGTAMGLNGSLTEWLTHILNLITGNTDSPGGRFYNPGLVDPLIAGDAIFRPNRTPGRVRGLPTVAGFHALAELPDEINTPGQGQIRALIMSAGNPVVSGPDGASLDAALEKLDLLVVSDLVQRESHRHADWLIPAVHWLEREEFHPLLSGLCDSAFAQMGRAVVAKPATIRHEWEFMRDLAIHMGAPLMNKPGVNLIAKASRLFARLSGNPYHSFGPAWISRLLVRQGGKASWKDIRANKHGFYYAAHRTGALRETLAEAGTPINAAPTDLVKLLQHRLAKLPSKDPQFPLQMLSRRRKHTMNSWYGEITAPDARDSSGDLLEIHPQVATRLSIADGELVEVVSKTAMVRAKAKYSPTLKKSVVVMEQGWGSRVFDPTNTLTPGTSQVIGVNRNLLVANGDLDPLSAVPRLNGTEVRIQKPGD